MITSKIRNFLFITLGSVFLLIGILGIFLPLLPTTPFLILTAICYNKGSSKFHSWLIQHRFLGPPILDWQKNRVIQIKYKILATSMMLISCFFIFPKNTIPNTGKIIFAFVLAIVLPIIWTQKSNSNSSD